MDEARAEDAAGVQAVARGGSCRVAGPELVVRDVFEELALELLRVRCLGMTADGSRQLRPGAPVARNSSVNRNPASAPDDLSMFQQDEKAVP